MPDIKLPTADRRMVPYRPRAPRDWERADSGARNRIFFAAAHVVADPLSDVEPRLSAALDWEATIAYRRYLWSLGLGVAEAMDTAQRGMGLDWPTALQLIRRSVAARDVPGALVFSGAGTDHLALSPDLTLDERDRLDGAVLEQLLGRSAVATTDDQHAFRLRMGQGSEMHQVLVIEELVLFGRHEVAVETK